MKILPIRFIKIVKRSCCKHPIKLKKSYFHSLRRSKKSLYQFLTSRYISTTTTYDRSSLPSSKIYNDCIAAIKASGLKSGDTLLAGGFGICGSPISLADALSNMKEINDLTVVSNNCGLNNYGLGKLLNTKQIKRMCSSYVGENEEFARQYLTGELEVELIPQGTLAEKLRAGGAGIPAFYTPTGYRTWIQEGKVPIKYKKNNNINNNNKNKNKNKNENINENTNENIIEITSKPKKIDYFNNKPYVLEESITGQVAIIKAHQADTFGNCRFRGTARNFNPECATAAQFTIVECEEIVPLGYFKPEDIHLPGSFVHAIVQCNYDKRIERLKQSHYSENSKINLHNINERERKRYRIVARAAKELKNDMIVNLGIGLPTMIPNFIDDDIKLWLQSENGILGMGPYPYVGEEDADLINAGKETITAQKGASIFSSSVSFGLIRGGHVDVTILGAMEVSKYGDIANWMVPGKFVKGMGGAMDLVACGSKVIATMEHYGSKDQSSKILNTCSLPLTGYRVVSRIITDLCVFDVDNQNGLTLIELLDDTTLEDVKKYTQCEFKISPTLKTVQILPPPK